jgi:hypothetical protein
MKMAKVEFFCDSGANIKSCRYETIDTVVDWGMEDGQWESMTEDEKLKMAEEWASDHLAIGYEEID